MQVFYGVATSTEIAYFTYIYAKVEPKHFQRVTALTRFGRIQFQSNYFLCKEFIY